MLYVTTDIEKESFETVQPGQDIVGVWDKP